MENIMNVLKADSEVLVAGVLIIFFFILVKFFTNMVIKIGMSITVLYTLYFFTIMDEDTKNKVRYVVSDYKVNGKSLDIKEYFSSLNLQKSLENVKQQDISLNERLEKILNDKNIDDKEIEELFKIKSLNNEKIEDLNKLLEPMKKTVIKK